VSTSNDPFSQVDRALWDLLEAHEGFTDRVRSGNRIKFSGGGSRSPMKDQVSEADLPEVRLIPTGGTPTLEIDSHTCQVVRRWEIQIATGDQRVDEAGDLTGTDKAYGASLLPVEWEILRAMQGWRDVLRALNWPADEENKPFVLVHKCQPFTDGTTNTDLNRGIKGWSTVWGLEVYMAFLTSDMAPDTGS